VPGIDKNKINVKAEKNSVKITREQSEKIKRIKTRIMHITNGSYRSFSRRIPIPEELLSRITTKMITDILLVDLPKTTPANPSEDDTKVKNKIDSSSVYRP
jgi:HSP20 family protein